MLIVCVSLCCHFKRKLKGKSKKFKRISKLINLPDRDVQETRYQPSRSGSMQYAGRSRSNSLPAPALGNVIPRSPHEPLPPIPQELPGMRINNRMSTGTYYSADSEDGDDERMDSIPLPSMDAPVPSLPSGSSASAEAPVTRRTFKAKTRRISTAVKRTLSKYVPKVVGGRIPLTRYSASTDSVYVAPQPSASQRSADNNETDDRIKTESTKNGATNSGFEGNWQLSLSRPKESQQRVSGVSTASGRRVSGNPEPFGDPSNRASNIPLPMVRTGRALRGSGESDSD